MKQKSPQQKIIGLYANRRCMQMSATFSCPRYSSFINTIYIYSLSARGSCLIADTETGSYMVSSVQTDIDSHVMLVISAVIREAHN